MSTKSSITLPAKELKSVEDLRERLGARTKVEVIRRALRLLRESTDRAELRRAYREASCATRAVTVAELAELEGLTSDGLDG